MQQKLLCNGVNLLWFQLVNDQIAECSKYSRAESERKMSLKHRVSALVVTQSFISCNYNFHTEQLLGNCTANLAKSNSQRDKSTNANPWFVHLQPVCYFMWHSSSCNINSVLLHCIKWKEQHTCALLGFMIGSYMFISMNNFKIMDLKNYFRYLLCTYACVPLANFIQTIILLRKYLLFNLIKF